MYLFAVNFQDRIISSAIIICFFKYVQCTFVRTLISVCWLLSLWCGTNSPRSLSFNACNLKNSAMYSLTLLNSCLPGTGVRDTFNHSTIIILNFTLPSSFLALNLQLTALFGEV